MVWNLEDPQGYESDKIAAFIVNYTRGRGLDIGCGLRKAWPHFIGFDNGHHFGKGGRDIQGNADDLSLFGDGTLDFIFSSHMLEHIPEDQIDTILAHWTSKIKVGGYLVLYVPSGNLYPKCGHEHANPDHKWDIYPGDIAKHLAAATTCGWTQVEGEERAGGTEYSLFEVYKKRDDGVLEQNVWQRHPVDKDGQIMKRALVIRYGGLGDHIITSSVFPQLKAQGYHVTYNTTDIGWQVCQHDPNIDEWVRQDTDQVPNQELGPYWSALATRYDRIINLSESIEVSLLARENTLLHQHPHDIRHKLLNVNYLERTHDIAGVEHVFKPRFYATKEELERAKKIKAELHGAPVVVWVINGSSPHKVYPFTDSVIAWLLENTPAHVYLYADPTIGKQLQNAIIDKLKANGLDTSRVHATAGDWPIRKCLTFIKFADVVVGPETGPMNAVSFENVHKIIYLSHSSHENLTKYWKNTVVLQPEGVACFPCHRLHYTWDHCNQLEETKAAACASAIKPETVFKEIADRLIKLEKIRAA